MDIVIDIGTSYGKLGFFEKEKLVEVRRFQNAEVHKVNFETKIVDNIIISSVSKSVSEIAKRIEVKGKMVVMSSDLNFPISVEYTTPETLGTDRLASIIGAYSILPGRDVLVIDAGTCVTYDLLTKDGVYKGGSISPGMNLRFKSLHNYTASLPLLERTNETDLTGTSTKEAILSGVINGLKAEMREIIRMYRNKFPHLQLVICGGDAEYFHNHLSKDVILSPDLVLKGLKTVLDHNV